MINAAEVGFAVADAEGEVVDIGLTTSTPRATPQNLKE